MGENKNNMLELDINKLFIERKIDEIEEIEKTLGAEIERKRSELRSMVGDRYKDILTASDSIKSMKRISTKIVDSIDDINKSFILLLEHADYTTEQCLFQPNEEIINERILAIQVRLTISINETIWMYLEKDDYLNGTQLYLLGQNIHTGLNFMNSSYIHRVPLLKYMNHNLGPLKDLILHRIIEKLESIELTSEQACSNLNGLLLLQNQNTGQLISIFMKHRKTALSTVINISHPSVRIQICAMLKCLITTIHLLYDCFMSGSRNGLIFKQLEEIVSDNSEPTLTKLKMPVSPLIQYIPQMIREFRPTCKISFQAKQVYSKQNLIDKWLLNTKETIKLGLHKSLDLVTTIKGLYLIREEASKIDYPSNWTDICNAVDLPTNFKIWNYFFQSLITERAQKLIGNKLSQILKEFEMEITTSLKFSSNFSVNELNLRPYIWTEDTKDIIKKKSQHRGLSMKAMGFSQSIAALCQKFDTRFLELLSDLSQYFYGVEFDSKSITVPAFVRDDTYNQKCIDVNLLQDCLVHECISKSLQLTESLSLLLEEKNKEHLVKSVLFCIRLLQGTCKLCPYFKKSCSINNIIEHWYNICENINNQGSEFWKMWIAFTCEKMEKICSENLKSLESKETLSMFMRWDSIEITEQTDDKVFKSQIKVPLKPSTNLEEILVKLNENLCSVLPHTLPKIVHVQFIESNVEIILDYYKQLSMKDSNQNQALQMLFDVKFLLIFCIRRENDRLTETSQDICDKLRSEIDPFDLDVFYSYLQNNVKRSAVQSQIILGCLLPSYMQIASLEISEKNKSQERDPCILLLSNPSTSAWFPLLPITAPSHKYPALFEDTEDRMSLENANAGFVKKKERADSVSGQSSSLFAGLTNDWFS